MDYDTVSNLVTRLNNSRYEIIECVEGIIDAFQATGLFNDNQYYLGYLHGLRSEATAIIGDIAEEAIETAQSIVVIENNSKKVIYPQENEGTYGNNVALEDQGDDRCEVTGKLKEFLDEKYQDEE